MHRDALSGSKSRHEVFHSTCKLPVVVGRTEVRNRHAHVIDAVDRTQRCFILEFKLDLFVDHEQGHKNVDAGDRQTLDVVA